MILKEIKMLKSENQFIETHGGSLMSVLVREQMQHLHESPLVDCIGVLFVIVFCALSSQDQFQKLGGVIRDNTVVTDIKPGPVVTVSTSTGVYRAKSVVITAGPWANKLLAHTGLQLPLEVHQFYACSPVPVALCVCVSPCCLQN